MLGNKTNKSIYYLMLVTEDHLGNVFDQDADEGEWEKLKNLPREKKDVVLSEELVRKMILMQEKFRLDDNAVGNINVLLRKVFFGELSLAECEAKIGSMLVQTGGGDPNQARAIVEFIQREILTIQPKAQEEGGSQTAGIALALLLALSKYANLGNQLITENRIKIKAQPEPVRPSLLNWLKYYREELGVGHHDNVQRGYFLFHSENGKKLSSEEREHISLLLKSVEDSIPLTIDTERQEIIFPKFQKVSSAHEPQRLFSAVPHPNTHAYTKAVTFAPQAPLADNTYLGRHTEYASGGLGIDHRTSQPPSKLQSPPSESGSVSFSTKHILPAEREVAMRRSPTPPTVSVRQSAPSQEPPSSPPAQSLVSRPAPQVAKPAEPRHSPFHIRPVGLDTQDY